MHFLKEVKSLLSSPGKMIDEQYEIKEIAQAETIHMSAINFQWLNEP